MKHELEQILSKNPKFLVDGVLNKISWLSWQGSTVLTYSIS